MENRIKERRTELGLTQEQIAKACGIGRSTIAEIESGKHIPPVNEAIWIARKLGRAVEELFIVD